MRSGPRTPSRNIFVIASADDLPSELEHHRLYFCQYDAGSGANKLYFTADGLTLTGLADTGESAVSWGEITGTLGDQADLDAVIDNLAFKTHTHTESEITDLGNYTVVGHTHVEADVSDLGAYLTDAPSDGNTYGRLNGAWAVVSGGGSKEYAEFYTATGGLTGMSNTALTLVIASTRVNSNGSVFSLASNEVTINKTADFRFSFDTYLNQFTTSRSEYSFWIERDSGGGYTEETATRSASYQRGYDSGMSSSINCILSVTSGDKFRVRVQRTDGGSSTGYQDDNGTRLVIEEK